MRGGFAALSAHLLLNLQSLKAPELKERLEESEKLIQEMTVTWEEKLRKTEEVAQVIRAVAGFFSQLGFDSVFVLQVIRDGFFCLCLQERQKQLESLGISLQSSGIKVGDDKCFLVNLNADPALNELLVYYLKVKRQTVKATHLLCVAISKYC